MATPIYLFTGFLDSGKTTLIMDTLNDPQFMENKPRTLILCLEQGETEYTEQFLNDHNAFIEFLDSSLQLTPDRMKELDTIYHPDQIFIEFNGSEKVPDEFMKDLPDFMPLVEILSTVDATTFESYIQNMRGILFEQLRYSDVVIVNRCTPKMSATMMRGNIKAINPRAQIYYEGSFGEPVEFEAGTLPFDLKADVIDISDDDYGLWYMDAMDDPDKYDGREMCLRGKYAEKMPAKYKQSFVLGRRAMVCCEQDTSLCGITVTGVKINELTFGEWVKVQGKMKVMEGPQQQKYLVMYADHIWKYEGPENEYVTFS
jgi:uncharacterized membrane protein YcgQ (UPF0703/DUF1980 family)